METIADYISHFISDVLKVNTIFGVTGGGSMYLTEGVRKNKNLKFVCNHHEQASAMAAVGYSKMNDGPAAAMVTTGCGGTNTITGLLTAWQDSCPVLFISGQINSSETFSVAGGSGRGFGVQEADIVSIVKPITKFAYMVKEVDEVFYMLQDAFFALLTPRKGPVWLDVPMDIQKAKIPDWFPDLPKFHKELSFDLGFLKTSLQNKLISFREIADSLLTKKACILVGQGARESDLDVLRDNFSAIPLVSTFPMHDKLGLFFNYRGVIGIKGKKNANAYLQEAEYILSLGCSLRIPHIGYHEGQIINSGAIVDVIDIDHTEHLKESHVKVNKVYNTYVEKFLHFIKLSDIKREGTFWYPKFDIWCGKRDKSSEIDLYDFCFHLGEVADKKTVIVGDAGSAIYVPCQTRVAAGRKLILSAAQAEMGFSLPASIGASFNLGDYNRIAAIIGDGSLQMNIQELQTLLHYKCPVTLFVWNNGGYLSIRNTQTKFFDSNFIGVDENSDVTLPDLEKIAAAYDIPYFRLSKYNMNSETVRWCLEMEGPCIVEVMCRRDQIIINPLDKQ